MESALTRNVKENQSIKMLRKFALDFLTACYIVYHTLSEFVHSP